MTVVAGPLVSKEPDQKRSVHTEGGGHGEPIREHEACPLQGKSEYGKEGREREGTNDDSAQDGVRRRTAGRMMGKYRHDGREHRKWRQQAAPATPQHGRATSDSQNHRGRNDHSEWKIPSW